MYVVVPLKFSFFFTIVNTFVHPQVNYKYIIMIYFQYGDSDFYWLFFPCFKSIINSLYKSTLIIVCGNM